MNYFEDIKNYANNFYPIVWGLLGSFQTNDNFSKFNKELLEFFRINFQYKRFPTIPDEHIKQLINTLILPTFYITQKEFEDFQDSPVEYLRIELEEADMDTNKYYGINLLKLLINSNSTMAHNYLNPLIDSLLNEYEQNRDQNWNKKISAINLIFAVVIKVFAQRSKLIN